MQTLRFADSDGPDTLSPGRYTLDLSGPAYAAHCEFRVPEAEEARSAIDADVSCRDGEVHLYWGPGSVIGFTLPQQVSPIRVRLQRGASAIYDGEVTEAMGCQDFESDARQARVCLFIASD